MKTLSLLAATAMAASAPTAFAQQAPAPAIEAGHTMLTVTAEGSSTREPDMANYSAGVTTQGTTASEALSANSAQMTKVIAALKTANVTDTLSGPITFKPDNPLGRSNFIVLQGHNGDWELAK